MTKFAPHTLRLRPEADGELVAEGRDDGFAAPAREVHHAAVGDAGFAAFVAHLPSVELFIGPVQVSALPVVHAPHAVTHAFAPFPVAHVSGFAASPLAPPPPPPTLTQAQDRKSVV